MIFYYKKGDVFQYHSSRSLRTNPLCISFHFEYPLRRLNRHKTYSPIHCFFLLHRTFNNITLDKPLNKYFWFSVFQILGQYRWQKSRIITKKMPILIVWTQSDMEHIFFYKKTNLRNRNTRLCDLHWHSVYAARLVGWLA